MNEAWREVFTPHPVPSWLEAFDGEPVKALDALLRRRFYLGNLQLAESDELLIDWLELLDGTDFPSRLDAAIAHWRRLSPRRGTCHCALGPGLPSPG